MSFDSKGQSIWFIGLHVNKLIVLGIYLRLNCQLVTASQKSHVCSSEKIRDQISHLSRVKIDDTSGILDVE